MQDIDPSNPEAWVRDNRDVLVRIIKHSDDEFTRALALTALVEWGSDPDLDQVQKELEVAREVQ